jgi:hypothetical protein
MLLNQIMCEIPKHSKTLKPEPLNAHGLLFRLLEFVQNHRERPNRLSSHTLEEKTVLNDYATTTKTVHNDSFSVVFQSLWTVLVVVA